MNTFKFIVALICAGFITAGLAGLISNHDFGALTVFVAVGIFFGSFIFSWFFIASLIGVFLESAFNIGNKTTKMAGSTAKPNLSRIEMQQYLEVKNKYATYSNEMLQYMYFIDDINNERRSEIEQTALKEELVKRNLIDHSF